MRLLLRVAVLSAGVGCAPLRGAPAHPTPPPRLLEFEATAYSVTGTTASGMQMVPMMGGMLVTSIMSGQLISGTGRYKIFPVLGTAVMTVGLFLLSRLTPHSTNVAASLIMLVLGIGLGMVMQVLVIAVQNDVEYRDLGVATSGATLFRLIGGSLGTAILGAIFAARLAVNLNRLLPAGAVAGGVPEPYTPAAPTMRTAIKMGQ